MPKLLAALGVLLTAGCLRAASGEAGAAPIPIGAAPSQLDYLVLASMADAPRPLAMALYRSEGT